MAVFQGEQPFETSFQNTDTLFNLENVARKEVEFFRVRVSDSYGEALRETFKDFNGNPAPKNAKEGLCTSLRLEISINEKLSLKPLGVYAVESPNYICDKAAQNTCSSDMSFLSNEETFLDGKRFFLTQEKSKLFHFQEIKNDLLYERILERRKDLGVIEKSPIRFEFKGINSINIEKDSYVIRGAIFDIIGNEQALGASYLGVGIKLADGAAGVGIGFADGVTDFLNAGDLGLKDEEAKKKKLEELGKEFAKSQMQQIIALSNQQYLAQEWAQDKTRGKIKRHYWTQSSDGRVSDIYIWQNLEFERLKAIYDIIGSILVGFAFTLFCELLIDRYKNNP